MDVGSITISGLVSDLDTGEIIRQLAQIRRRPIELLTARQNTCTADLTIFQQLTAKVLGLGAMVTGLSDGSAFEQVTVSSSDQSRVVATGSAGAAVGGYELQVARLAGAHKVSSGSFAAPDQALGLSGEFLLGGRVIGLAASDTLEDLRDAINAAGAGATASILTVSATDHRLLIASRTTGEAGALDLVDANDVNLLEDLGLADSTTSIKHAIVDGAASDTLSDKLSAVGSALGLSGTVAGTVTVNGTDVDLDLSTDSLAVVAAALDAVDGVSASVVVTEGGYRVEIVGAAGIPTLADDGNVLATLGVLTKPPANELAAAQDAQFSIDAVSMTRSSNAVDDAIEGVQLQLLATTGAEGVRVGVSWNVDAAVSQVQQLVTCYNDVVTFINAHQKFDSETGEGGAFLGNIAVMNLVGSLRGQVTGLVNALGGGLQFASQIGLTANRYDQLVFDSAAFRQALRSDPVGVQRLFGVAQEATSAQVAVLTTTAATQDSGAEGWAVTVTQVAARATATSADLGGGIAIDETLTIGGKSVTLTAGMSLQDAADLLNGMFSAQKMSLAASVVGDALQVEHELWGASYGVVITSSLDDGSGGTDLGGATAGQAQSYVGADVAGTIGGMDCTGRGQRLSAAAGTDAEGLTLLVTATAPGDLGVVRVSKGIASRLTDYIAAATDLDNGSLTRAGESFSARIDAIGDQIAGLEAELDRYIEKLQSDFARMEARMSQSRSLLEWMTLQIDYLPGLYNSSRNR